MSEPKIKTVFSYNTLTVTYKGPNSRRGSRWAIKSPEGKSSYGVSLEGTREDSAKEAAINYITWETEWERDEHTLIGTMTDPDTYVFCLVRNDHPWEPQLKGNE